ncbi:MAG: MBL fold metallo-hydrolase [Woeseiaceae bacterium]|nr:MBL fold metallo-hydrolase [Woeseiaceae bacterium]
MQRQYIFLLLACIFLATGCARPADTPVVDSNDGAQVQNRGSDTANWWDALPRPEWGAFEMVDQDVDWFEVYRVADGIFAIYEPGQFEEVISFLIVGNERALLFDTGLGIGDMRRVVDQLTRLPVIVLNSHTHYDHIGGNYQFKTIYALDTEYTKARAKGSSTADVAEFLSEGWVWKELPPSFDAASYRSQPFSISRIVAEGDRIELGGRTLEILETPGHAPDSICLIDRENRLLFTGDTFYLAPLYTHIPGGNFDDYARSAARLAGLVDSIDSALTSHNVPVVQAGYMTALGAAFEDIRAGRATDYTESDGNYEYRFDGFSVIVRMDEPGLAGKQGN